MSEHTPGPWHVAPQDEGQQGREWRINGWADVEGFHGSQDCLLARIFSIEANARLIAAAPDLLAALERICLLGATEQAGRAQEFARAAIAKATAV